MLRFLPRFLLKSFKYQCFKPLCFFTTPPRLSLDSLLSLQTRLNLNPSCPGCGVLLQLQYPSQPGFIDPKAFEKKLETSSNYSCQRCHHLKSNKTSLMLQDPYESLDLHSFISKFYSKIRPFSLIIYLLDLSNLTASLIPSLLSLQSDKKCRIWLVINKIDTLPIDFDPKTVRYYLRKKLTGLSIPIPEEDIFFLSSLKGLGFDRLLKRLKPESQTKGGQGHKIQKAHSNSPSFRKAYVIGCTNTGKSTFINQLVKKLRPHHPETLYKDPYTPLTTSPTPNTTLEVLEVENFPLNYKLYDTPGIPNELILGPLMSKLIKEHPELVIRKQIKAERVILKPENALFLGGLFRLDFPLQKSEDSEGVLIHIYTSYQLSIHRTLILKANEVFYKQYGKLLSPVFEQDPKRLIYKKHTIELKFGENGEGESNLEFPGLGWLRFSLPIIPKETQKVNLVMYLPDNEVFNLRDTMMSMSKRTSLMGVRKERQKKRRERIQKIDRKVIPKAIRRNKQILKVFRGKGKNIKGNI